MDKILKFKKLPIYKVLPEITGKTPNGEFTTKDGKTNLYFLNKKKGLYSVFENGKLVYIGSSTSNLYKTIMRHFNYWQDSEQPKRISYKHRMLEGVKYEIEVAVYPESKVNDIFLMEKNLISLKKPRDNKNDYYHWRNNKFTREEKKRVNDCVECLLQGEKIKESQEYSFNKNGELLDENGNVLF